MGKLIIIRKARHGEMIFDNYSDKAQEIMQLLAQVEVSSRITSNDKKVIKEYLHNIEFRPRLNDDLWLQITHGMIR